MWNTSHLATSESLIIIVCARVNTGTPHMIMFSLALDLGLVVEQKLTSLLWYIDPDYECNICFR